MTQRFFRNDLGCIHCGAKARTRTLVAEILFEMVEKAQSLSELGRCTAVKEMCIYNLSSRGAVHDQLNCLGNYLCSEYFPGVKLGSVHHGIRCEDLECLSFDDSSIDLMISEDVMEHIRHPETALQEARRVLKPGGKYIFTVPIHGEHTLKRVDTSTHEDIYLVDPVYHGDPLREEGALAYNDFGSDIVNLCDKSGFSSRISSFEPDDKRQLCGDVIVATKSK